MYYVIMHFSKTIECTPRVNPRVHCGLRVTMMCHCTFILGKNVVKVMLIMEAPIHVWEEEVYGKPFSQFCSETKTAKKKKLFKKNPKE